MKRSRALVFCLMLSIGAALAEDLRVLPADFNRDKTDQMMRSYQRQKVHAALDRRLQDLKLALGSKAEFAQYQQQRREFLQKTFGPLPDRGSLNPRITGKLEGEGYRVEKVLFESLPGYHITANLYLPQAEGPFPGVLLPCGHSANGKAYESYQKMAILLARHQFVVLCFDPVGQGERRQLVGDEPHPILRPKGEHNLLGTAPILLGRSLASMMVWDGVRALDYLCGRPEVDAGRIGCTGNSGGGNLTSYLMAFDERIVAAAPGCFMTTHRRKNEKPGPGDAEQNLFAQIREGFDHADFILCRAPKPTLILSATRDYVPIEGAWEAFRQAKRAYTLLGCPERIDLVEANEKHGLSVRLREATVRFMARWLQGRNLEVFEPEEVPIFSDEELQVTAHGQVRWLEGARSIFDVFEQREQKLAADRDPISPEKVRQFTGIHPLDRLPRPDQEKIGSGDPEKWLLRPEPGIVLPAVFYPGGDRQPILMAPGAGINQVAAEALKFHSKGHPVLVLEVRDTGETATRNWRFYGADFFIGQMLGTSWLAMRTEDILTGCRWLFEATDRRVLLHARGEAAPAAMHAAYLEPGIIAKLQVEGGLSSWKSLMRSRDSYQHIHQSIHGVLRHYDLPDLIVDPGE